MFKDGSYVDWCEYFGDGFPGRDWGDGIIIDTKKNKSCIMYRVFRNKHKDFYWFEEQQLKLKEIE